MFAGGRGQPWLIRLEVRVVFLIGLLRAPSPVCAGDSKAQHRPVDVAMFVVVLQPWQITAQMLNIDIFSCSGVSVNHWWTETT